VIGPAKSASGRVVLASDPHRAYSTPSLRYIAHISAPELDVIGGGEPALPGVSIGHNGTAAFALTRFYIDQQDLYVYELNPDNRSQYRYRGGWEDMRVIRESVAVKGAPAVTAELAFTRHGPVIYADDKRAFAVRSCWLEPGTASYFGSASYMTARNPTEFRTGVGRALAPGLNFVYGDTRGQIGWVVGGLSPVRPNWDGLLPVPGDGRYEWNGFLPTDQLPSVMNPATGFFSSSNEMNLPEGYTHQLGYDWANPSRHERIESVLRANKKLTLEDSLRLQTDVVSLPGRRLAALLAPLRSEDPQTRAALELLRGWDGEERVASGQAALYEVWTSRHLGRGFLDASLPPAAARAIRAADMGMMLDTLEKGGHVDLLLRTLRAAYEETQRLLGPDATRWQWGNLSHSLPPHPLLGYVDEGLRAKLQVGPFPRAGGPHTPNMSAYRASDFRLNGGPSLRLVMDVGQWDNSRAVNHPGQSGDPDSPHYRDLAPMWSEATYFPLLYSRAAVEKAVRERIVLTPTRR
jgi:penicillin G amidase